MGEGYGVRVYVLKKVTKSGLTELRGPIFWAPSNEKTQEVNVTFTVHGSPLR